MMISFLLESNGELTLKVVV